jgi:hypothetical protein
MGYGCKVLGGRVRSPLVGVAIASLSLVPAAVTLAAPPTPPAEAYPPAAIVNLLDPFGCAPSAISGDIGAVLPGSVVTLQLVLLSSPSSPLSTATATAAADGHADYSIPVPPNRFGPVVVGATGVNTVSQPFSLETAGRIVDCPPEAAATVLPSTGSSGIGTWLRGGGAAVLAGAVLLVAAVRRRRHSMGGAG